MTREEYCLTWNLARLRTIRDALGAVYECDQIPAEKVREIRVAVDDAIQEHDSKVADLADF